MNMRPETINALDIWRAPTIKESKKLLRELKKEIAKIKAWHEWSSTVEDLKFRIANGEGSWAPGADTRLDDLLREAEKNRDDWSAEYR